MLVAIPVGYPAPPQLAASPLISDGWCNVSGVGGWVGGPGGCRQDFFSLQDGYAWTRWTSQHWEIPLAAVVVYTVGIASLSAIMRDRDPIVLPTVCTPLPPPADHGSVLGPVLHCALLALLHCPRLRPLL